MAARFAPCRRQAAVSERKRAANKASRNYGSAKATNFAPFAAPVATTTNCFPAFVLYVIGTEYAFWPRSADHRVVPFSESIAYRVAPPPVTKTKPPAVTIGPGAPATPSGGRFRSLNAG